MSKLVFGRVPAGKFFKGEPSGTITITHKIDVTDTIFKYQLIQLDSEGAPTVLYNTSLNIAEVLNHPRFSEQSFWSCPDTFLSPELVTLTSSELVNLGHRSLATKSYIHRSGETTSSLDCANCPWLLFVPHKNATLSECTIRVVKPDVETNLITIVNIDATNNCVVDPTLKNCGDFITDIECTTQEVSSNMIKVAVSVSDTKITQLYLEPICGLLDRTVVNLINGVGTFNVLTNTLSSGDVVSVKVGYKHFSNVTTYTKTIV